MLDIAPNPYLEPIKKFIAELKATNWKFPYIPQILYVVITIFLIVILGVLYATVGLISQISNSFWDLIVGLGQKMSFASPITSSFYALSATIYFILFLPFFIIQSPIWLSGWFASKIGFKAFIIIIISVIMGVAIYFYKPSIATNTFGTIVGIHDSLKKDFFSSELDSLNIIDESDLSDSTPE